MQLLIVWALVAVCAVYASWSLMPAAARRALARALLRWPLLGQWRPLRRAAGGAAGGCSGCGDCGEATIQVVRRPR